MGGLTGRPGADPAGGQAAADPVTGLYRRSQVALTAAFVMLAGALVAFAMHARTIGIVLLVLMLLCGMASFCFSVVFRNRAVAQARREQAARAAGQRKSSRPGPD